MEAKDLFREATKEANSCIIRINPDQLKSPTPCDEWNLRDLVQHMVNEMAWVPDMLAGKTIDEIGDAHDGDLLGSDPVSAWRQVLEAAQAAVDKASLTDTVHLSYGDFAANYYIREAGSDMLIHGWDVGQALYCDLVFNRKAAQAVYDFIKPREAEFKGSGLFGEVVPTNAGDSLQTKLLALYGRQENWQSA